VSHLDLHLDLIGRCALLCSAPLPLPSTSISASAFYFTLFTSLVSRVECRHRPKPLSALPGNNTKLAYFSSPPIPSPPRPAPPRAFPLKKSNALQVAYQLISSHLTLQWRSRAAHAIPSLHSYGVTLASVCLSTLACPSASVFLSSSTPRECRAQTQDSTFENTNLRPPTPLKKRLLHLWPSSEEEFIRSCLNIAPSLPANPLFSRDKH
jgi:hypothetical protein